MNVVRNRRVESALVWAGILGFVLAGMGLVVAGFVPPPSPEDSSTQIAARFHEDATRIRVGMLLCAPGFMLIVGWGCVLAVRTWSRFPALALAQLGMLCTAMFIGVLFAAVGQLATFRAGDIDPATTQTLADLTFFVLLILAPFELWLLGLALAILYDDTESVLPRWTGWFSLWCFTLQLPALFISFTKTGPLAYSGVLAFWVTGIAFFTWMAVMSVVLLSSVARGKSKCGTGHAVAADNATLPTG